MDNKEYDVVCVGVASVDMILTGVDNNIMNIDSTLADSFNAFIGGDGANGAINLSRLGLNVCIACNIGNDNNGNYVLDTLKKNNVGTKYVRVDDTCHTGCPIIIVDDNGDRHIIRIPNSANHSFELSMVNMEALDNSRHLHFASANVVPMMNGEPLGELFKIAHGKGLTTSLDASYDKSGKGLKNIEEALYNCDVFIPSFQEASVYAESEDLDEIIEFFKRFPLKVFGIKLGENGVVITDFKERYDLPTLFEGKPVDTTGAGDAFISGFVAGWLRDYNLKSCAYLGSAQSVSVISKRGACDSAGTLDDALKLLESKNIKLYKNNK